MPFVFDYTACARIHYYSLSTGYDVTPNSIIIRWHMASIGYLTSECPDVKNYK